MSTRKAIIDAAARLFAEKGYEGMTVKLIADEVGITPSAIYAFYKNKEDVFFQVYKEVLNNHLDIAQSHSREFRNLSTQAQLHRLLRELFHFHFEDDLQLKIFMRLLLFPPKVFQTNLKEALNQLADVECQLFAELFEEGMRRGEVRAGDSAIYARALLCMMDGLFWQLQRCVSAETFWEGFELAWGHFWDGIKRGN
ncbi:TetR/AcrR family transcriptional regulator [Paenibacillus sp. IB182496]|uniref:TetR/AcrR family transcriptional regulator n=1 Tax=Paenibacillus sabuli TaxID=2772509 RepID=A0A927BW00_9BACL|nr:TetR/AcrR family transcriptional regulator [Paenibacillus sabuli]MBD2847872.1 TetR/AcrR family transcriptional regulator [Paenibacillus sabuli]